MEAESNIVYLWWFFVVGSHMLWVSCLDERFSNFIGAKVRPKIEKLLLTHWTLVVFIGLFGRDLGLV